MARGWDEGHDRADSLERGVGVWRPPQYSLHNPETPLNALPVLLDTDIGSNIDDSLALAYLLRHPGCDLLGVSTVSRRLGWGKVRHR